MRECRQAQEKVKKSILYKLCTFVKKVCVALFYVLLVILAHIAIVFGVIYLKQETLLDTIHEFERLVTVVVDFTLEGLKEAENFFDKCIRYIRNNIDTT